MPIIYLCIRTGINPHNKLLQDTDGLNKRFTDVAAGVILLQINILCITSTYQAMKWDLTGSDDEEREGCTCAVCLDVYYSPYKCHPCSHVFCEPCLRTLAKNRPSSTPCPLCRTLISHVLFQEGEWKR